MQERAEKQLYRNRQAFLDVLRVAATCAVVMMHTISGVLDHYDMTGYGRRQQAFLALIDLSAWCVPVFLMISGYLFLNPERKITWKEMLGKYVRRVLLALIVFGIPYSLMELVVAEHGFGAELILKAVWNTAIGRSWAHMWYLYLILGLYLITPVLKWLLERIPVLVLYFMLGILLIGCSLVPFLSACIHAAWFRMPEEGIYLFYYLCGYLFVLKKDDRKIPGVWELSVCAGIMAAQIASRFAEGYHVRMAYAYPPTVLLSLLMFAGAKRVFLAFGEKKQPSAVKTLERLSELCFGIYLIHPVFLNFFYKFLGISLMDFRFWTGVPLFFGISLAGAAAGAWILRKIPVFRHYVL
ncbi:MAG: acyltransferase [Lachnospiraceae bacterium]|nr:acyltransferase [Lachnospiraceae bacterium]